MQDRVSADPNGLHGTTTVWWGSRALSITHAVEKVAKRFEILYLEVTALSSLSYVSHMGRGLTDFMFSSRSEGVLPRQMAWKPLGELQCGIMFEKKKKKNYKQCS